VARKNFRTLMDPVMADPVRRARVEEMERAIGEELRLSDLRRARGYTQRQLAAAMGTPQPGIARLEKQADVYLSTLRSYVEAMGGRLELRAVFDDATVPIADLAEQLPAEELEVHGIVVVSPPAVAAAGTVASSVPVGEVVFETFKAGPGGGVAIGQVPAIYEKSGSLVGWMIIPEEVITRRPSLAGNDDEVRPARAQSARPRSRGRATRS
jgi:helix-turn-helix protein